MSTSFAFNMTDDPDTLNVYRNDKLIATMHREETPGPRLELMLSCRYLSIAELRFIMEKFQQFLLPTQL